MTLEEMMDAQEEWLWAGSPPSWKPSFKGVVLANKDLSGRTFEQADLAGANLQNCPLSYTSFRDADLRNADFRGAAFDRTCLEGAKLDGAVGLPDIPAIPDIHQTVWEAAKDKLDMENWHNVCGTTHCRAGWVVTLAGEQGKKLERMFGTPGAAWLIYKASDPNMKKCPDFYCTNEQAKASMRRAAKREAEKKG